MTTQKMRPQSSERAFQPGKLPPQALDLERAVLGAMLIESGCIPIVLTRIKHPDLFYAEAHQEIFACMVDLFNASQPVDLLTVTHQLRRRSTLEKVGGPHYIAQLSENVNSAANIETHITYVYEQYLRRQIISLSAKNLDEAYEQSADVQVLLEQVQLQIVKLTSVISQETAKKLGDVIPEAYKEVERAMKQPDGITGIPSGIPSIDRVTGGWQPSDFIVIAARPAMGKTTMVLNFLKNASLESNAPVLLFSLEMSIMQLSKKMMSMQTGLTTNQLVKGRINMDELLELQHRSSELLSIPFLIDDSSAISIGQIRAKSISEKMKHNIQLIVIDYLQLITTSVKGSREQEIAHISRSLKLLAKDLNVPVIALSQLSRSVEQRTDKRPLLSDIRESGAIEQDADMVCFLFRPGYYGINEDEAGNSLENVIEFIISKHRNGALANLRLKEELKYSRIHDWDDFKPTADQ